MPTRTRRQREVLDFIIRYIDGHGYEPSYQLIARELGVSSKAGIAKHIKALEEQGLLRRRRRTRPRRQDGGACQGQRKQRDQETAHGDTKLAKGVDCAIC